MGLLGLSIPTNYDFPRNAYLSCYTAPIVANLVRITHLARLSPQSHLVVGGALVSTAFPWFPYSAYTQDPDFRLRTLLTLVVSVLPWNNYIISDLYEKTISYLAIFFTK